MCDVLIFKDRAGLATLLTFLEKSFRARILEHTEGPDAGRWVLATPSSTIEVLHDKASGNRIVSQTVDSDETVQLMGETLEESIASRRPLDVAPNAWTFGSGLKLVNMLERLTRAQPRSWFMRDSHWASDYITGKLIDGATAQIFEHAFGRYVVNLSFKREVDPEALRDRATGRLLDEVLPLIEARRVKPCAADTSDSD